jgi:predicted RNase H-like HicB family nuclease
MSVLIGDERTMKSVSFRVLLKPEPEGGYTVTVPSLPGCVTFGDSIEDAVSMAREAIGLYLESLQEHGDPIPDEDGSLEYLLTVQTSYA